MRKVLIGRWPIQKARPNTRMNNNKQCQEEAENLSTRHDACSDCGWRVSPDVESSCEYIE